MLDVIPQIYGPLTASEQQAVDEYRFLTAGVLDTFEPDAVDGYTLDELQSLAATLGQWWGALDALDSALTGGGDGDGPPRPPCSSGARASALGSPPAPATCWRWPMPSGSPSRSPTRTTEQ